MTTSTTHTMTVPAPTNQVETHEPIGNLLVDRRLVEFVNQEAHSC